MPKPDVPTSVAPSSELPSVAARRAVSQLFITCLSLAFRRVPISLEHECSMIEAFLEMGYGSPSLSLGAGECWTEAVETLV